MKFVFIHGGPGLNSNPEKHLLTPLLKARGHEIIFWNEPSHQRDMPSKNDLTYHFWLKSLSHFLDRHTQRGSITVLAHSFGAFAVNELLPLFQDKIAKIILIAPIFDLRTLDKNILDLAIKLYAKKADTKNIQSLTELKKEFTHPFNQERFMALLKALEHEEVLPSYWLNKSAAASYNQFFVENYQFDLHSFKGIRESVPNELIQNQFRGTTHIIYGHSDPVARLEQDFAHITNFYPESNILIAQSSGHYPHIEEMNLFLENFIQERNESLNFS